MMNTKPTDAVYYSDINGLSEEDKSIYKSALSKADYTCADFKRDVTAWLTKKFGDTVKPGDKAISVPASGNRRNADVLVAAQFRRYHRFKSSYDQRYDEGICFWTADGTRIANHPKQHSEHCTTKHQTSVNWFKPTVRIYKTCVIAWPQTEILRRALPIVLYRSSHIQRARI